MNNRGIKKDPSAGDWWYSAVQYIMELAWCRVLVSLITLSSNTYIKSFFALLDISDTSVLSHFCFLGFTVTIFHPWVQAKLRSMIVALDCIIPGFGWKRFYRPSQKGRRQSVVVGIGVNACWKCLKLQDKYSVPLFLLYIHSTFYKKSDPRCYSRFINDFSTSPFFLLKCLQYVEGFVSVGQQ